MYSLIFLSVIPAIYAAPLVTRQDACTTGHVQCNASSGIVAVCIEGAHRTLGPITGLDCSQVPVSLMGPVISDKTNLGRRQDITCDNGFYCDSDMNEFALCMNEVVVARIDVTSGMCPFIFPQPASIQSATSTSSTTLSPGPTPPPVPVAQPIKKRQDTPTSTLEASPAVTSTAGDNSGSASEGGNPGDGVQAPDADPPIISDIPQAEGDDSDNPPSTECSDPSGCSEVYNHLPVVDQGGIVPVAGSIGVPIEQQSSSPSGNGEASSKSS